jgi:hypothetical protein
MMENAEIKRRKAGKRQPGTPTRTRQQLAEDSLDRRARHLAIITRGVPVFVCRNLLKLFDADIRSINNHYRTLSSDDFKPSRTTRR